MYSRHNLQQARQPEQSAPPPVNWDAMIDGPVMSWDDAVMGSLRDHLAKHPPQITAPPVVNETSALCGSTRVWLVRDGERWEMYAGSRKRGKRTDFASPWLRHAIEVAEDWYGKASRGWTHEGAKMPSQESPE